MCEPGINTSLKIISWFKLNLSQLNQCIFCVQMNSFFFLLNYFLVLTAQDTNIIPKFFPHPALCYTFLAKW